MAGLDHTLPERTAVQYSYQRKVGPAPDGEARLTLDARYKLEQEREEVERDAIEHAHNTKVRREFRTYTIFLFLFCTVTFWPRNEVPFRMEQMLQAQIAEPAIAGLEPAGRNFWNISYHEEWYDWVEYVVIPGLLDPNWYNGDRIEDDDDGFSAIEKPITPWVGYTNLLVGNIRLRQLRVRPDACTTAEVMRSVVPSCVARFSSDAEQTSEHARTTWQPASENKDYIPWRGPFSVTNYPGSGYVVDLPVRYISEPYETLRQLRDREWLDRYTRVVFVDFTVYNANEDIFAAARFAIEFLPSGYLNPSVDITKAPLIRVTRTVNGDGVAWTAYVLLLMEIAMFGMAGRYAVKLIEECSAVGRGNFFGQWWNIMDTFNMFCFGVVFVMRIASVVMGQALPGKLDPVVTTTELDGKVLENYMHFWLARQAESVSSFNAALCFFRFFKYLTFWRELQQLVATMLQALSYFATLLVMVITIFVGYSMAFAMAFGHDQRAYMDLSESFFHLFSASMGEFDLTALRHTNRYLGPLLFVSFMFIIFFIVLAMVKKLAVASYQEVRATLAEEEEVRQGRPWGVQKLASDMFGLLRYRWKRVSSRYAARIHAHKRRRRPARDDDMQRHGGQIIFKKEAMAASKEAYRQRKGLRAKNQVKRDPAPPTQIDLTMAQFSNIHASLADSQQMAEDLIEAYKAKRDRALLEARGANLTAALGPRNAQSFSLFDDKDYSGITFSKKKRVEHWRNPFSAPVFRATVHVEMPEVDTMVPEDNPLITEDHIGHLHGTADRVEVELERDTSVGAADIAAAHRATAHIEVPPISVINEDDIDALEGLLESERYQNL